MVLTKMLERSSKKPDGFFEDLMVFSSSRLGEVRDLDDLKGGEVELHGSDKTARTKFEET